MEFLKPTLKLSIGVTSTVTTVLIFAFSFGFIADPTLQKLENRAMLCEQLAYNCSLNATQRNTRAIPPLVKAICNRDEEILSAAVRNSKGKLLFEIGDHVSHWTLKEDETSTSDEIQVPIMKGKKSWGVIELRFEPVGTGGMLGFLRDLLPPFIVSG